MKLKNIRIKEIEQFLDSLFTKEHLKPRTVKDIKATLNMILERATEDEILIYNPATVYFQIFFH